MMKVLQTIGNWFRTTWNTIRQKPAFITIIASMVSIGLGIIFGLVLLLVLDLENSFYGFGQMLTSGFSSLQQIGKVLYIATPLIMTGLAVGFAFKTGLFNIGASGQYVFGAFFAMFVAMVWGWPWWLALIASAIGGAIWGSIPGIFKAYLNVNEVITSIMFNWIGLHLVNLIITSTPKMMPLYWTGDVQSDRTVNLEIANPSAIIPRLGLDQLFDYSSMNLSIILAIVIAIVMYIILHKTTFGYELKACGLNRHASRYAGINTKRNIILSMTIAGALAGIGGGMYYLAGVANYTIERSVNVMGFNGIPVALIASSDPVGTIFSALFISYIQIGGDAMQPEFSTEIINIIISIIIYMSAFSILFKSVIFKWLKSKKEKQKEKEAKALVDVKEGENT